MQSQETPNQDCETKDYRAESFSVMKYFVRLINIESLT
mgnify:CR=1 FL=1